MTLLLLNLLLDQLLTGFVIGASIWFFFLQAPAMFQYLGREKFVPIMMHLVKLWVKIMFISTSIVLVNHVVLLVVITTTNNNNNDNDSSSSTTMITTTATSSLLYPGLGWLFMTINKFIVVPKALKAGARSHAERVGDNSRGTIDFVYHGGAKTQTKTLHQTVVLFVLLMTGLLVLHLRNGIIVNYNNID